MAKKWPVPSVSFNHIMGQGKVNQLGGVFINGRPLPKQMRLKIIELSKEGVKPCHISRKLRVSHGCVSKILNRYSETGSVNPGKIGGNSRVARQLILSYERDINSIRKESPDLSASEIRHQLLLRGVCSAENAPSSSAILRFLRSQAKSSSSPPKGSPSSSPPLKHSIDVILGNSPSNESREGSVDDSRRARTSFTVLQLAALEASFYVNSYPGKTEREQLAEATGLNEDKIQVWFSNRRARNRKTVTGSFLGLLSQSLVTEEREEEEEEDGEEVEGEGSDEGPRLHPSYPFFFPCVAHTDSDSAN